MKQVMSAATLRERMEKLSESLTATTKPSGNVRSIGVDAIEAESKKAQVSRNKARILTKMSPSLRRGLQILSGMIACPEGGIRTNLTYDIGDIDGITEEKKNKLITTLKDYFENQLDLENKLHDTVYRILSEVGADVEVYIPTTLVDEVLGLESTGFTSPNISEDKNPIKYDKGYSQVSMSTNMNLLTQSPLSLATTVGAENETGGRSRLTRINKTTMAISSDGITGADNAIVRKTTGESIIPIMYNGRVIKYVGLLDDLGNFIETSDQTAFVDLMAGGTDGAEKAQYDILGSDAGIVTNRKDANQFTEIRRSIEDDVIRALTGKDDSSRSGLDGVIRSLGEENVVDIITARVMASNKTRVVLIDPEYVSYFSLIQNENGRGITIIEDNSSILLLHVTLLYAKILSELENSIPQTTAEVTLDDNDANPEASLKDIMGELAMSAIPDYNLDYSGNRELFRSLSKMNTSVKVMNADIPGMPNMDVNIERSNKQIQGPSSDILEQVGRYATQSIGISSDHVDNSYGEKFKIQVVRDNDITSRQLQRYVSLTDQCLTDRGRKRVSHNDDLWTELCSIIGTGDSSEDKLIEAMATFSIKLPESSAAQFESFARNMDGIAGTIKEYLEYAIPDTIIDNGERIDTDSLSTMREMVGGAVMRSYALKTDMFGGLGMDVSSMAGIGQIIQDELESYGDEFKKVVPTIRKFNKKIQKAEDRLNAEDDDSQSQTDETTSTTETSTDNVTGSEEDFSLDDNPDEGGVAEEGTPEVEGGDTSEADLDLDDMPSL